MHQLYMHSFKSSLKYILPRNNENYVLLIQTVNKGVLTTLNKPFILEK